MTSLEQPLVGVHLLQPKVFTDKRGDFVKTYHREILYDLGLDFTPAEEFLSTSRRGVLRGMHFQLPPHEHSKLVYCVRGSVLDVLLDLRKGSGSYGQFVAVELSHVNRRMFFIPAGVAHGFVALEDDSVMIYKTSTVHAPIHDAGIRWDSFGFAWPGRDFIISDRDTSFPPLAGYVSPF